MMNRFIAGICVLHMMFFASLCADVTRGFINTQGSANAVMTINSSGVQQLTSNYTGEIVISASNVTLDLRGFTIFGGTRGIRITGSNVTVQNGTIRDATIGVRIEGSNNHIFGVDMISNTTGMEIVGNANIIRDCTASNNSSAGFSLVSASRNRFYNCTALDNGSTSNAYGFISQDGVANTFEECIAERTQTSGASPLLAAGFLLTGTEQKSKILNSQMSNSSGTSAYGMRLQGTLLSTCTPSLSTLISATFDAGATVFSVAWQQIGASYYIAAGGNEGSGGAEVRVLKYDSASSIVSSIATGTFDTGSGSSIRSLDWSVIGSSAYIAAAGAVGLNGANVRVLSFNPTIQILSALATATAAIGGSTLNAVAWQQIGQSYYIAVDGPTGIVSILQFNPITQVLSAVPSATFNHGGSVFALSWLAVGQSNYLAVGGGNGLGGAELRVLFFNQNTQLLSQVGSATFDNVNFVRAVDWQTINSTAYLAFGGVNVAGADIRVFQFNPVSQSFAQLASATYDAVADVYALNWLSIGSSYYLGVGDFNGQARVLAFNPATNVLSVLTNAVFNNTFPVFGLNWQQIASSYYLTIGGSSNASGPEVRVLQFDDCQRFPLNNIIMQNQASGNVTGFQDDASINSLNQWIGNFGANNTTNFNISTQFPISSATGLGDGVADNLDALLTNGGPAQKIMATVVDQLTTLTGPMAVKNALLAQYGITPIIGTTTLTSMKSYCLANDTSGTIFILTSSFILLDLNEHTVGNIVVSNSQFLDIENGRVNPNSASTDGISFTNSGNISLQNIDVAGARNGLIFTYSGVFFDSSMMVQNCTFNNNAQVGVRVVTATYPNKPAELYFYQCAARNNGSHGFFLGSARSKYYQCEASNNGGRGFSLENTAVVTGAGTPASVDFYNAFIECTSVNNTGTGFHMQGAGSGNIVGACYASGNGGANYSSGVQFTPVADSTTNNQYWSNVAQSLP